MVDKTTPPTPPIEQAPAAEIDAVPNAELFSVPQHIGAAAFAEGMGDVQELKGVITGPEGQKMLDGTAIKLLDQISRGAGSMLEAAQLAKLKDTDSAQAYGCGILEFYGVSTMAQATRAAFEDGTLRIVARGDKEPVMLSPERASIMEMVGAGRTRGMIAEALSHYRGAVVDETYVQQELLGIVGQFKCPSTACGMIRGAYQAGFWLSPASDDHRAKRYKEEINDALPLPEFNRTGLLKGATDEQLIWLFGRSQGLSNEQVRTAYGVYVDDTVRTAFLNSWRVGDVKQNALYPALDYAIANRVFEVRLDKTPTVVDELSGERIALICEGGLNGSLGSGSPNELSKIVVDLTLQVGANSRVHIVRRAYEAGVRPLNPPPTS